MFWVLLLVLAWASAGFACARLCLAAMRTAAADREAAASGRGHDLTLYEAAFLSGGPTRVADLTMVSMARQRRLLLAHTGWATVVDPRGHDEMERSVIGAIGPGGQSLIAPVRAAASGTEAVRTLADDLVRAGLAIPEGAPETVAAGLRQVRATVPVVLALGAAALLLPDGTGTPRSLMCLWFALPLLLTLSGLAIARFEGHSPTRWASPAGQRLLGALKNRRTGDGGDDGGGDERSFLTSVAVRGIRAIGEPALRAAFTPRDQPWRE
ncbi:TIGR04222 domain-containing membrane protein [Streptomyces sp. NPDC090108]|uniref:TIGR04222 domain-containing membrane protein n=1 Tax=Streptomyces sp. NPDC090108 TaxID=3365947 RepID=UPI003825A3AB